jgi:hypothetical protein
MVQNNRNTDRDILTEQSFYPPFDDRFHCLGIEDVPNGDTYDEYLEDFWKLYENELFD